MTGGGQETKGQGYADEVAIPFSFNIASAGSQVSGAGETIQMYARYPRSTVFILFQQTVSSQHLTPVTMIDNGRPVFMAVCTTTQSTCVLLLDPSSGCFCSFRFVCVCKPYAAVCTLLFLLLFLKCKFHVQVFLPPLSILQLSCL